MKTNKSPSSGHILFLILSYSNPYGWYILICSDENEVDVELNETLQITARNILVDNFRKTGMKKKKVQKTSKTIQYLHGLFSTFEKVWENCQVEETAC